MGFTTLDGLVMATRPGALDPGVVTWLQRTQALDVAVIEARLTCESGLLGVSGQCGDLPILEAAAYVGDERARLAVDVMLHRLVISIGAMAAAAGGLDALVFTGGVGENSARVRRSATERLAHLGVAVSDANEHPPRPDADITAAGAAVATLVIRAREDLELAREARIALAGTPA
jgi:acetate kinase